MSRTLVWDIRNGTTYYETVAASKAVDAASDAETEATHVYSEALDAVEAAEAKLHEAEAALDAFGYTYNSGYADALDALGTARQKQDEAHRLMEMANDAHTDAMNDYEKVRATQ